MTTTTQSANTAPDTTDSHTHVGEARVLNWRTEALYGAVAGVVSLAAFDVALVSGMPKPGSYSIVGFVCLWLVVIGVDRAVKWRRARR